MPTRIAVALVGLLALGALAPVFAFSPYEARIANGKPTYVGLLAAAKSGLVSELDQALQCLACPKCTSALNSQGVTNLSINKKILPDQRTWYWVCFEFSGKDYLKAAGAFERAAPRTADFIEPHPRAKTYGTAWLQMEWICYFAALVDDQRPTRNKVALVTRIKAEMEQPYRTLHQTVWPGVVDQVARTNHRNLSIFLVELGDEIYEFLYMEYVGHDADTDGKASKSDPCTLRWWKLTDACQHPLPDAKDSPWAGMEAVVK